MSRTRNADELLSRLRALRGDYDRVFVPRLAQIRAQYTGTAEEDLVNQHLEAHVRAYLINGFLAALNWRLDASAQEGLPALIPEAPVRSSAKATIRFMDYLGLEADESARPLLIVETKAPSVSLPIPVGATSTVQKHIASALGGERIRADWKKWLREVGDYVCSSLARTREAPRRVVITNGEWLVLFLNPLDAFVLNGTPDPDSILVFENQGDLESRYRELYSNLEHQHLLDEARSLVPGEAGFHVRGAAVDGVMHGLRLHYVEQPTIYTSYSPVIKVAPVMFVRTRYGSWLRIEMPPREFELPHDHRDVTAHLKNVGEAAAALLADVNRRFGTALAPTSVSQHFVDPAAFEVVRGVVELSPQQYLIATGGRTHFLSGTPSVPDCPYHDWAACSRDGVAAPPGPVTSRSVRERSFFMTGEVHYCGHRDVAAAKAAEITVSNRDDCGPRSGGVGQAFCEIWHFERQLCCRTCVFEGVCTAATAFRLPCTRPALVELRVPARQAFKRALSRIARLCGLFVAKAMGLKSRV